MAELDPIVDPHEPRFDRRLEVGERAARAARRPARSSPRRRARRRPPAAAPAVRARAAPRSRARYSASTAPRAPGGPRIGSAPSSWPAVSPAGISSSASGLPRRRVDAGPRAPRPAARGRVVPAAARRRRSSAMPPSSSSGRPGRLEAARIALPRRDHDRDRLGLQAAGGEQRAPRRRAGRATGRRRSGTATGPCSRVLGEQAEQAERDQEPVLDRRRR